MSFGGGGSGIIGVVVFGFWWVVSGDLYELCYYV